MKKLTTLLSLLFSLSLVAETPLIPVGQYEYARSEVSFVKDVRVLNTLNQEGRDQLAILKKDKYSCQRFPRSWFKCIKFINDRAIVDIPLAEILKLTPSFDEVYEMELISESDYLSIYQVEQLVETPLSKANQYRLYIMDDGVKHLDIELDSKDYRFNYKKTDILSMQLTKRKSLGKNNWMEYGILSFYRKL